MLYLIYFPVATINTDLLQIRKQSRFFYTFKPKIIQIVFCIKTVSDEIKDVCVEERHFRHVNIEKTEQITDLI